MENVLAKRLFDTHLQGIYRFCNFDYLSANQEVSIFAYKIILN